MNLIKFILRFVILFFSNGHEDYLPGHDDDYYIEIMITRQYWTVTHFSYARVVSYWGTNDFETPLTKEQFNKIKKWYKTPPPIIKKKKK